jgi:hypothetical protein
MVCRWEKLYFPAGVFESSHIPTKENVGFLLRPESDARSDYLPPGCANALSVACSSHGTRCRINMLFLSWDALAAGLGTRAHA